MTDFGSAVTDVRNALVDPKKLVEQLGLGSGAQRQATGMLVRCPAHEERTPSCSVTLGPDGTVRVRCFGCDFAGDAITLVAQVRGLELRGDRFKATLAEAAELGGLLSLAAMLRGSEPPAQRDVKPPTPRTRPEAEYPPLEEVTALWERASEAAEDTDVSGYLVSRSLDPDIVTARKLGRALFAGQPLPPWARYQGQSWLETGHQLITRMFDHEGKCRSVRACRVKPGTAPKRLPPAGHKSAGLVLANRAAVGMLLGATRPARVVVVEGEPDWFSWCTRTEEPVIGIGSGWWSQDFADRVPAHAEVILRTHDDDAGERYAAQVAKTLGERCVVWRAA